MIELIQTVVVALVFTASSLCGGCLCQAPVALAGLQLSLPVSAELTPQT